MFRSFVRSTASFIAKGRILAFRILLLAAIPCVIYGLVGLAFDAAPLFDIQYVLIPGATAIHHILSTVKWRFYYGIVDYVQVCCELAAFVFFFLHLSVEDTASAVLSLIYFLEVLAVLCFFLYRTTDVIVTRGRVLITPFDFVSRYSPGSKVSRRQLIFGMTMEPHISGEPSAIRVLRGCLSILFTICLGMFAIFALVVEPLHESSSTPIKTSRTLSLPQSWSIEAPTWNIVALAQTSQNGLTLGSAITLTPVVSDNQSRLAPCSISAYGTFAVTFLCPLDPHGFFYAPDAVFPLPDILITVNFSMLGIVDDSLTGADERTISFYIGMTNTTEVVIENASPVSLVPGHHLYGRVSQEIRQTYNSIPLAVFGLFPTWSYFRLAKITSLTDDPSSLISRDNTTATLRLSGIWNFAGWKVIQDNREKTVFHNLAFIGGLWTLMNGILLFTFGCGLVFTIFGRKPLSIFGFTHRMWRNRLRETLLTKYPQLLNNHTLEPHEQAGLLAFIREHILQLNLIEPDTETESVEGDRGSNVELLPTVSFDPDDSTFSLPEEPLFRPNHSATTLTGDYHASKYDTPSLIPPKRGTQRRS